MRTKKPNFRPQFLRLLRAVRRYAKKVRLMDKAKIKKMLAAGERFSVTTDEYTSTQNKRFSAVSLHPRKGRPIKIGMIRIRGSLPGKRAASELKEKLNEYSINDDNHLVANTTDGASMMKTMGREFLALHQLCHSHGIHLAGKNILKIFYPNFYL